MGSVERVGLWGLQALRRPYWDDPGTEAVNWVPPVNVCEDKDNVYVEAQVPGIDMKDVKLSVTDHTLLLEGERKCERTENEKSCHVREVQYGSFARSFRLPGYVDPDSATATYDRGVLTMKFPRWKRPGPN